ncbi:hypothetical protein HQ544_03080 [Candidatus Falkowbacteria bacterium]|nr:hypothetical protein [Candidatus Falkowbacteria bacterium]
MEEQKEIEESTSSGGLDFTRNKGERGAEIKNFLEDERRGFPQNQEREEEVDPGRKQNFKKAMAIAGVLIFGAVILVLGIMRIRNLIGLPFEGYGDDDSRATIDNFDEALTMRNTDTDKDGLSDYDETYVHGTSIYLEDTDSDGYTDREEVVSGEDPLCAVGVDCYGGGANTGDGQDALDVDLDELRQMLIEGGMDKEMVEAMDDATLLELYNETVHETGENPLSNNGTAGDGAGSEDLDINEIRQYLIEAGIDEEVLGRIDDETLRQMYNEAVAEISNE